jgi:hypothetical protein
VVHQETGTSFDVRHDPVTGAPFQHVVDAGSIDELAHHSVSLYDLSCVLAHKFQEPAHAQVLVGVGLVGLVGVGVVKD